MTSSFESRTAFVILSNTKPAMMNPMFHKYACSMTPPASPLYMTKNATSPYIPAKNKEYTIYVSTGIVLLDITPFTFQCASRLELCRTSLPLSIPLGGKLKPMESLISVKPVNGSLRLCCPTKQPNHFTINPFHAFAINIRLGVSQTKAHVVISGYNTQIDNVCGKRRRDKHDV